MCYIIRGDGECECWVGNRYVPLSALIHTWAQKQVRNLNYISLGMSNEKKISILNYYL